jgi:hypothetical protein
MPAPRAFASTCAIIILSLSLLVASASVAAPAAQRMVAVVRTVGAGAEAQEVATRIIAELMASEVAIVAVSCAELDTACSAPPAKNIVATVLIVGRARFPRVAVLGPSHAGKRERIDVTSAAGAAPTALAVRTMEVLRAMLLEPDAAVPAAASPASSPAPSSNGPRPRALAAPPLASAAVEAKGQDEDEVEGPPEEPNPLASSRAAVRLGPTWFGSVSGLVSSFGAAASLLVPATPKVQFSAFLAGGAFGHDEQTADGVASVTQALGLVQAELHGTLGRRFGLSSGLGVGFHYLRVEGSARRPLSDAPPAAGASHTDGRFSPAFSGSMGATVAVSRVLALFLEGRVFFLTQIPVVLVNGAEVGQTGDPGLSLTAGIEFRP